VVIAGRYSFNGGAEAVSEKYPDLLQEIEAVITGVDAQPCKIKISKEKTMAGQVLFSPVEFNKAFARAFYAFGWKKQRVVCEHSIEHYEESYKPKAVLRNGFREMDFLKNGSVSGIWSCPSPGLPRRMPKVTTNLSPQKTSAASCPLRFLSIIAPSLRAIA
jgi:hypothetical protein